MCDYYNTNQLSLDISYAYIPEPNHTAHYINQLVDQLEVDHPYVFGRPREYPLSCLLKLILFAYTREVFTRRKIERLAQENLTAQ
ncbi:hypothetical protein [Eremococcus coleocola]|uniref:hypothetical protein n=1 Tax=Eremococcus coleocola TaxID=88132 RepID=UPI0003FECFAD|nr:hypothetical protein [Eremococcus coleocola]